MTRFYRTELVEVKRAFNRASTEPVPSGVEVLSQTNFEQLLFSNCFSSALIPFKQTY